MRERRSVDACLPRLSTVWCAVAMGLVSVWPTQLTAQGGIRRVLASDKTPRVPVPGDLELRIEVRGAGGLGVTFEPVVVVAWLTNTTDDEMRGRTTRSLVQLVVTDEAGREFAPPPRTASLRPSGRIPHLALGPRQTSGPHLLLVDRFYRFTSPGKYVVRAAVAVGEPASFGPLGGEEAPPPIAQCEAEHEVREGAPQEYERLSSFLACWAVTWMEERTVGIGALPPLWQIPGVEYPLKQLTPEMLSRFGREEALPHLVQLAHAERKPWCFGAIRDLGTPAARAALELLATSCDREVAEPAATELARWAEESPEDG